MIYIVTLFLLFASTNSQNYGPPQNSQYGPPGHSPGQPLGRNCPPNDPNFNKNLVREGVTSAFSFQYDKLSNFFTNEYIQHNPMAPDGLEGFKGFLRSLQMSSNGAPNLPQVQRMIAQNDFVWTHSKYTLFGTNYAGVDIFRIECGKIAEHWDVLQDTALKMPAANSHPFF